MTDEPLRERILSELVVERDTWASERATRVTARLDGAFETLVFWSEEYTAFTAPGRTIYISRRLFELLPDDDATAFVIGHELAHHRLHHVPAATTPWYRLPLEVSLAILDRWIAGPNNERDADRLSIELCIDAGFDPERCIAALEILDKIVLDYGDVDGSIGPERDSASWARSRGYHSMRERIAAVRAHAEAYRRGQRVADELAQRRERRRRRLVTIAGAVAAAGIALIVLRRPR